MATMTGFWGQVKQMLAKFSFGQKMSLGMLAVSLVIGFILIMSWASRPKFTVLFSTLNPKDAGRIIDELKTAKVPYKLESGGTLILVPEDEVYEQRMKFATLGIPQEGIVGYEIFDETKLGMTDFIQKLNYHRALEGELARTLTSIDEISQARVHIVIPKPALFEEDKKLTTASVVIRLRGSSALNREQVQGVANLVASSVEGLIPENISIVDSRGNVLSSKLVKDRGVALSSAQYDLRSQIEMYLEEKAQSMLLSALGPNRSIVRVTTDLNFNRIERTKQTYDPEGQVVRSEEVCTKAASSGSETPQPSTSSTSEDQESTITNYEITNTLEHVVNSTGNIERLSVAVLVDGNYRTITDASGEDTEEYIERSTDELDKLGAVVKNAIGFNPARGDQITVTSMAFGRGRVVEVEAEFAQIARYEFWQSLIQKVLLGIIGVIILLVVRRLFQKLRKLMETIAVPAPVPEVGVTAEGIRAKAMEEVGRLEEEISLGGIRKAEIQKKISEFIIEQPAEATQLIRTWLYEE
ncbi:MAG: flagellar M-ring protein FliF [candidate division Zixibacteria bacterium]|nr:flagellar M-ring protein FliF [Candidatus Tariuqbacter arcticus]